MHWQSYYVCASTCKNIVDELHMVFVSLNEISVEPPQQFNAPSSELGSLRPPVVYSPVWVQGQFSLLLFPWRLLLLFRRRWRRWPSCRGSCLPLLTLFLLLLWRDLRFFDDWEEPDIFCYVHQVWLWSGLTSRLAPATLVHHHLHPDGSRHFVVFVS